MSKEKQKLDPVVILLDLIIIAMIYVMLVVGFNLYQNISYEKRSGTFMQDALLMSHDLQLNNYSYLVQGAYMNKINNYDDAVQYHELANYTEAAFLYKVFSEKGKQAEADRQKDSMDNARKAMGSLTVFADKVDVMIRDFGKN